MWSVSWISQKFVFQRLFDKNIIVFNTFFWRIFWSGFLRRFFHGPPDKKSWIIWEFFKDLYVLKAFFNFLFERVFLRTSCEEMSPFLRGRTFKNFHAKGRRSILIRRLLKGLFYSEGLQRRPPKRLLYLKIFYGVFSSWKTYEWSSLYGRPLKGLFFMEDLLKGLLYIEFNNFLGKECKNL